MKERTEVVLEHMLENAQDVVTFAEQAGSFKVFSEGKERPPVFIGGRSFVYQRFLGRMRIKQDA